ncbi:MAG: 2-phospho-L-lactate guanylyltransferase [Candidatus Limnocylindrales bacterium]|jgi:2-phospho-L-lactate guanylyltransferase
MSAADFSRIVAIVPVRSLSGAKTRLGEPLDPEERADLILAFLRRTVAAALASRRLDGVAVVSKDPELLRQARAMGAASLLQESDGLNEGLVETREAACAEASAILVLPADLPAVSAEAIDRLAEVAVETGRGAPGRPVVVLVPDRHGTGTNALLVSPPDAIPFRFGEDSRAAHAREAAAAGAAYAEVAGPLAFDVDTAEDLLEADSAGLDHEAGR